MEMPYRRLGGFVRRLAPKSKLQSLLTIVVFIVSILPPLNVKVAASLVDPRSDGDPCRSDVRSVPLSELLPLPVLESDIDEAGAELSADSFYAFINRVRIDRRTVSEPHHSSGR
jgi:hypothetical protein